jgi:ElaB/YqjD/DUF883 family membrane-anchored ribosome-binding protein
LKEKMMQHGRERVREAAERLGADGAMDRVAEQGRWAVAKAREMGESVQHTGEHVAHGAQRTIRHYPLTTVVAAVALGLCTGFLLTRRGD